MARTARRTTNEHQEPAPTRPVRPKRPSKEASGPHGGSILIRPKRPSKEPSGPHGGWMKLEATECHKAKQDENGRWVETVICAHSCDKKESCKVYILLMSGSKERIRALKPL